MMSGSSLTPVLLCSRAGAFLQALDVASQSSNRNHERVRPHGQITASHRRESTGSQGSGLRYLTCGYVCVLAVCTVVMTF